MSHVLPYFLLICCSPAAKNIVIACTAVTLKCVRYELSVIFQYSFVTQRLSGFDKTVYEELTKGLLEFLKPGADSTITSSFLKVSGTV